MLKNKQHRIFGSRNASGLLLLGFDSLEIELDELMFDMIQTNKAFRIRGNDD